VSREEPADLEGLIALSIRIDNRIRERRRERLTQDPQVVGVTVPCVVSVSHSPCTFFILYMGCLYALDSDLVSVALRTEINQENQSS